MGLRGRHSVEQVGVESRKTPSESLTRRSGSYVRTDLSRGTTGMEVGRTEMDPFRERLGPDRRGDGAGRTEGVDRRPGVRGNRVRSRTTLNPKSSELGRGSREEKESSRRTNTDVPPMSVTPDTGPDRAPHSRRPCRSRAPHVCHTIRRSRVPTNLVQPRPLVWVSMSVGGVDTSTGDRVGCPASRTSCTGPSLGPSRPSPTEVDGSYPSTQWFWWSG